MKASLPIPRIPQLVVLVLLLSFVLLLGSSAVIAAHDQATPTLESVSATDTPPLPEAASTADATPIAGAENAPEVALVGEPICGPTRHVSGDITADTWWDAGYVYVLDGDVTVKPGATLRIDASVIKANGNASIYVRGRLLAVGTESFPRYFTSLKDDTLCGDTNGDGGASSPAAGDWGWIEFGSDSDPTSILQRVVLRYGGQEYYRVWRAVVRLNNVVPVLENLTFTNNWRNAVELVSGNWTSKTLPSTTVVYWLGGDVTVPKGNTLTINPGVKVKVPWETSLYINGKLLADGTTDTPVTFTAESDDTVCGAGVTGETICDANNDEAGSSPAAGNWGWIEFGSDSDPTSILRRAVIRYGGQEYYRVWSAAVRINRISPTIAHNRFKSNYRGIELMAGARPSLVCNDLSGNSDYGIYNNTPANVVEAEGQWWGSSSGPRHASNPNGLGDKVTDGVDFTPWATFPCTDVPLPGAQGTLRFSPGSVYNPTQPIWFASSVKNTTATPHTFRVIMRLLRDGAVVDTQSLDVNLAGGNSSVLSHNFDVRPTGQYQVRGELWLGGILLAARSVDVTVLDAGAQRVAEEYATELKQTAREEFDQMADIPAKIVGSSITDWGWDKVTSLFSGYFGQAAAPAKEADPIGASDANVERGLQEGRKLLGEAGDKVRVYTAGRLRAMIYQRTGVLLPEWFDPLNPDASLSGLTDEMKGQVKKIIKDEVTAVVKEYFFKAGFTEPQMRQIEARDGQFDAFLLGHPVNWTSALEGIFNRGRDAIRSTVESDAIVTLGPVDVLGRTVRYDVTLLEQQRKYEEVKQFKGTLAAISQALTVVGVVLALLIFIGAIAGTGGLATTLLPLLWKTVAFLGKLKSVVLPLALTFLTVTMTVSVPVLAPRVTTKHDQTLDQVEALTSAAGHSVALAELAVTSASAGEPVHANALVKNMSGSETASPLVETTIYSVDGRVIQVLWAEPTLGPGQSAQLDKEIALPQGNYRAVTALHTAEGLVGEAVTQPFTVSGIELQTGVRLERTTLGLGAPVHATVVVTNTSPTSAAENLTLVVEASDGQNFQAWPVSLGAGQTWQTSYSFVPPAEGSYILRASLSSGFDALAAADASYVVGSGPSLAVGITAQAVYAPGAAIVFPLSVANNGNAASAATLKAITLDRLHDLTAVYTTTLPVNLAAGAQTTLSAVALPVALAQPGLYTTQFLIGDLLYRTLDFAVSAQDTLFADVSPDQVYRNAGDTVSLEVQVLNAAYAPTDAAVAVSVRRPDGVTQSVIMNAAGVGKYQGSMVAALAGTYAVNATVTKAGYRSVGNECFFVAGQRSQLVPAVQGQPLLGVTQPLTVTVRNERGAAMPAATLTISNSTELVTAHTDQAGQAMIQLSPAITDTYHVTIEKMGFDRTLDGWPVWVGEDYTPPALFVDAPSVTNRASLTISGLTEPGATVMLNSQPLSVDAQGRFSKSLTLAAGANTFTFTAKDKANNTTSVARSIILDTTPPNLTVTEPADGLTTGLEAIRVSGVAEPGAVVTVNDVVSAVNPSNGAYSTWAVLRLGANSIVVTATDQAGNVRTVTRRINRALRVYLPLVRR